MTCIKGDVVFDEDARAVGVIWKVKDGKYRVKLFSEGGKSLTDLVPSREEAISWFKGWLTKCAEV